MNICSFKLATTYGFIMQLDIESLDHMICLIFLHKIRYASHKWRFNSGLSMIVGPSALKAIHYLFKNTNDSLYVLRIIRNKTDLIIKAIN